MRVDPFIIKEAGGDIRDRGLGRSAALIDGDIIVSDSYRKHPRHQWAKFKNNSILFYACLLLFTILGSRLFYLQVVRGADYYASAEANRIRTVSAPAPRGVIFDRQGKRLAYNVPDFGLYVVPADLPDRQADEDKIFAAIGRIIDRSPYDLVEGLARIPRTSFNGVEIVRGLSQEQAVRLRSQAESWQGISIQPIEQRNYAPGADVSHVLGYTGAMSEEEYAARAREGYGLDEYVGKTGLEKIYQNNLRGRAGAKLVEVDSLGKEKRIVDERASVPGTNLYLHLDAALQNLITQELAAMVARQKSTGGSAIVLSPRDGGVLALVNYPSFDNNLFARGISAADYEALLADPDKPLFNRAIAGEYPSGSTFKIVVGAAALEEKLINDSFTVLSTGGLYVNGYWFPDWKAGGHGRVNIIGALADSVNTFFYTIGGGYGDFTGLGLARLVSYGKLFGLTEEAGIDLPGERTGFLPTPEWKLKERGERWFLGDTYHLSIGQGDILVTPLQVANYTAVIANGGTLFKPKLAERMVLPDGSTRALGAEVIRTEVVSPATIATIRAGLRAVVTGGSARSLGALAAPVAGKTGTAEHGEGKPPHAWFTGFGPYDNPEIVVTVLVENGQGGDIAATPIAKKIFEYYFKNQRTEEPKN